MPRIQSTNPIKTDAAETKQYLAIYCKKVFHLVDDESSLPITYQYQNHDLPQSTDNQQNVSIFFFIFGRLSDSLKFELE